jgi:tRNA dimethylallyltransferase
VLPTSSPATASGPGSGIIAIVGATATGKSQLAIALAQRLDGEIINADALQLYRGMDVGTAKMTPAERAGVPHHLLDVLDVDQEAGVATYQQWAREAIDAVRARGHRPVLVGGSGLYVRAALDRISFPPTDPTVRARLEDELAVSGEAVLYERLRDRDPDAAAGIRPGDGRRIVRALEVGEITGESFRSFLPRREYLGEDTVQIGLHRERVELHDRIRQRVLRMVEDGLLDEVRGLREQGLDRGRTARRAIGYEQALAVLDGTLDCAGAIEQTVTGTRRLVRKQDTWFRRDPRVRWIDADAGLPAALATLGT